MDIRPQGSKAGKVRVFAGSWFWFGRWEEEEEEGEEEGWEVLRDGGREGEQCIRRRVPKGWQKGSWSFEVKLISPATIKIQKTRRERTESAGQGSHVPNGIHTMSCCSASELL